MGKLADEARAALDAAREDAKAAWTAFEEAKSAAEDDDEELTTERIGTVNELHDDYQRKAAVETERELAWERTVAIDGAGVRRGTNGNGAGTELELRPKAGELAVRTPGARFVESEPYKELMSRGALHSKQAHVSMSPVEVWTREEAKTFGDPDYKAIVHTGTDPTGGALVINQRLAEIAPLQGVWPRTLLPYIPRSTTDSDTVEWVEIASFTNSAAPVTQAVDLTTGLKPQSDMTLAIKQSPVQTIAHWIPATRQALADAARLSDLIDQHLRMGIEVTLESQVLNGSGTAPNLRGILNTVGINAIAPTAIPATEAIFAGIGAVLADGYQPNLVVMNPTDFGTIRLSKDTTGAYHYGPPLIAGPTTIWGLPTLLTPRMAAGMALVGDFNQCTLWVREATVAPASSEHADFFIRNLVAILAEGRWGFAVTVPSAFASVDLVV